MGFMTVKEANNQFKKYKRAKDFSGWRSATETEATKILRASSERNKAQKRVGIRQCLLIQLLGLACLIAGLRWESFLTQGIILAIALLLLSVLCIAVKIAERKKYEYIRNGHYIVLPCEIWKVTHDREIGNVSRVYVKSGDWIIHPDSFLIKDSEISEHIIRSELKCLLVWCRDTTQLDLYMV